MDKALEMLNNSSHSSYTSESIKSSKSNSRKSSKNSSRNSSRPSSRASNFSKSYIVPPEITLDLDFYEENVDENTNSKFSYDISTSSRSSNSLDPSSSHINHSNNLLILDPIIDPVSLRKNIDQSLGKKDIYEEENNFCKFTMIDEDMKQDLLDCME